jgi:hypothetical protein
MGYVMMRYGNRGNGDVAEYKEAGKKAKEGIEMITYAVDSGDKQMIVEGAEKAFKAVKKMCEISDDMESQYGERRNDGMGMRGGYGMRGNYGNRDFSHYGDQYENFGNRGENYRREWNERDDRMMERRMRDAMGRFR